MDRPLTWIQHLTELRLRIIYSLISIVVGVLSSILWVPALYRYIMAQSPVPLTQLGVTEVFMVQFHMGIWLGLVVASPFILYQLYAFLRPALQPAERKVVLRLLPATIILFVIGFMFSYILVVPAASRFFIGVAVNTGAPVIVSPSQWVDLIMQFSVPLGVVFELPVVVLILSVIGLVTSKRLRKWRKYALLASLIVGAFISPAPLVVDQVIMAVPMLLLYEVSIWITRVVERRRSDA